MFLEIYCTRFFHSLVVLQSAKYRNDPKFSDRYVWAVSADPDQTAAREQSDQGRHCLLFHLHHLEVLDNGRTS